MPIDQAQCVNIRQETQRLRQYSRVLREHAAAVRSRARDAVARSVTLRQQRSPAGVVDTGIVTAPASA